MAGRASEVPRRSPAAGQEVTPRSRIPRKKSSRPGGSWPGRASSRESGHGVVRDRLDGLRRWGIRGPVSDLVAHTSAIREALTNRPVRTVAEAAEQIECLTGLKRGPDPDPAVPANGTGVPLATHPVIPSPPKKDLPDHIREQKDFLDTQLQPRLDEADAGGRHVFFVDAAHFVFGTFLCSLWSLARIFVKS